MSVRALRGFVFTLSCAAAMGSQQPPPDRNLPPHIRD